MTTSKNEFNESAVTRDDEGKFSSSGGSGGGGKPSKEWEAKYGHKARQNKKFLDSKSGKIAKAKASNQSVIRDLHGNLVITSDNPINHSVRGEDGKFHMVAEIVHNKNSQSYKEEEQKQAEAKKKFERSELGKRIMADVAERKKRNLAKSDAARAAAEKKKKSGDWRAAVPQFESSPGQMSLLDQPKTKKSIEKKWYDDYTRIRSEYVSAKEQFLSAGTEAAKDRVRPRFIKARDEYNAILLPLRDAKEPWELTKDQSEVGIGYKDMQKVTGWEDDDPRSREERTFYRSGSPPKSGRSFNTMTGSHEAGVSVYVTPQPGSLAGMDDRPIWYGKGKQVSTGGDEEPVIEITGEWKPYPGHKKVVEEALESGKLTPDKAESLGHFDDYPDLKRRFHKAPTPPPKKKTQSGLFGDEPDEEDDTDESDNPDDFPLFSKARDKAVAAQKKKKDKTGAGSPQGTLFETRKQPTLFSLAGIMQAEFYARGYYRTLGIPIHEISGILPKTPETVENS